MLSYNDRKFIIAAEYDIYKQRGMSYNALIDRIVDILDSFELSEKLEKKEKELLELIMD